MAQDKQPPFSPYPSKENFVNRPAVAQGLPKTPIVALPNLANPSLDDSNMDYLDVWKNTMSGVDTSKLGRESIPLDSFSHSGRYSRGTRPGDDWEEGYAQNQEWYSKGYNGVLKGLNLAGTTVAGGFGTLYGGITAPFTGKLSTIWDNPVMNTLAEWNDKVDQEYLPNFYTQQETDANWYSTDNWFTANFLFDKLIKNSGFAVGAMYSGNIANSILTRGGSLIGSVAGSASSRAQASQAFKLFSPILKNTSRAFSQGKNIEASKILQSQLKSIGDIAQKSDELAKILNTTSQFANFGDKGKRALIAMYSSAGEASFEALWGSREYRDKLIEDYINEFGEEPSNEALSKIDEQVSSFGKTAFIGNMALLGVTEYVQLPYLMGSSYRASKKAANSLTNRVARDGSIYSALPATKSNFGKLYQTTKGIGRYIVDPKEMAQEMGQYALQVGSENYFNKAQSSDSAEILMDGLLYGLSGRDAQGEGVGALVSKEGIESGILGGLTGGLMQAKRKYSENATKKRNTAELIESSKNSPFLKDVIKDRIQTVNRGTVLQQQQEDAVIQGDLLESKDLKTDLMFNYGMNRIKYGRTDLILDEINELRGQSQTETGLAELKDQGIGNIEDTPKTFNDRLTEIETFLTSLDKTYEKINNLYGGLEVMRDGEKVKMYSDKSLEYLSYSATKIQDYTKRINDLSISISNKGVNTTNLNTDIFGEEQIKDVSEYLTDSSSVIDIEEVKSEVLDYIELNLRKKKFIDEYKNILEAPDKFVPKETDFTIPTEDETEDAVKETIKLTTRKGEKDIEIGTEYLVDKIVEKSKTGQIVNRMPKLTVLGKNDDGTIKVRTGEGDIFDVNEKQFAKYKLNKASDLLNDVKWKFVLGNWNNVYLHKGIKVNGKPVRGRIEHSDKPNFLYFTYVNENGRVIRVHVDTKSFNPAEGYSKAMIVPMERLSAVQQTSYNEIFNLNETPANMLQAAIDMRNEFIIEYYNETITRSQEIQDKLESNKNKLQKLIEQINNSTTLTKTGVPRKRLVGQAKRLVDSLIQQQQLIENEIVSLESEQDELNDILPVLESYFTELSESKEDNRKILDGLKSDINNLENLIDFNNEEIKKNKSLLKQLQDLLQSAFEYLNDFIKLLRDENPGIPTSLEEYRSNIERYMGEEAASNIIDDKLGFTETVTNLQSTIEDFSDELNIPDMEKESGKLVVEIEKLENELTNAIKQQVAKRKFLDVFSKFVQKQEDSLLLQEKLTNDKVFKNKLFATSDKRTIQTSEAIDTYEPNYKKQTNIIPISTTSVGQNDNVIRSNNFGFRFDKFKNRDRIKGVRVNVNNQNDFIPGLIESFENIAKEDGVTINPDEILMLAMVEQTSTGEIIPVDQFGQRIVIAENETDEQFNKRLIDSVVYQVYPLDKLSWSAQWGEQSMFRKDVPQEEQDDIRVKYAEWRNNAVKETSLLSPVNVSFSFGIPQKETFLDEEGNTITDYDARNSIQDSFDIDDFSNVLITIPKTNKAIIAGTVEYDAPYGVPFLMLPDGNGAVKLENRKLSDKEASVVYESILEYSKAVFNDEVSTPEANRILTFLKSIVYWGIPKTQSGKTKSSGHNSVFFDTESGTGRIVLKIGKEKMYDFTPFAIEENKELILNDLENLYNNINSHMVSQTTEKYEEITSLNNGKIQSIIWPNYQSYLLSKTKPGTKGLNGPVRDGVELPLATNIRKLVDSNDVNREGIYYYTPDIIDEFKVEVPKKGKQKLERLPVEKKSSSSKSKSSAKDKLITEIKKRRSAAFAENKDKAVYEKFDSQIESIEKSNVADFEKFITDGSTVNIYVSPTSGKMIPFFAKEEVGVGNELETIQVLNLLDTAEVFAQIKEKTGKPDDEIKLIIRRSIVDEILSQRQNDDSPLVASFSQDELSASFEPASSEEVSGVELPTVLKSAIQATEKTSAVPLKKSILDAIKDQMNNDEDEEITRLVIDELNNKERENWNDVEKWLKSNVPNIPLYRVKNVIQATNGRQAWGMFKNGSMYVYENAEVGTTYHEVFHGVWRMFTDEAEQSSIINEFKNREGSFFNRSTASDIKYSDATNEQVEEALAEEFKDYVQFRTIPKKPTKGRPFIVKMFYDLFNFIKGLFISNNSKNLIDELFKNINQGKYKKHIPYSSSLESLSSNIIDINDAIGDDFSPYSLITLKDGERNDIIQEMTYRTLERIIKSDESLFNISSINKNQLYTYLKHKVNETLSKRIASMIKLSESPDYKDDVSQQEIQALIAERLELIADVDNNWDAIIQRHGEYLKSYGIEFDENDNLELTDEDKAKEDPFGDATKIDTFKKASPAIKMILSTLPLIDSEGKAVKSSIDGMKLMPVSTTFITIMNRVYDAENIDDMLLKLKELALEDNVYAPVYKRLTGVSIQDNRTLSPSTVTTTHHAKLLDAFWKTFKKQNPKVLNLYILENGEVSVGNANFANSAEQLKQEYLRSINDKIRNDKKLFEYNDRSRNYSLNKKEISNFPISTLPFAVKFLNRLGIPFTDRDISKMDNSTKQNFLEIVGGIKKSLMDLDPIKYVSGKVLNIDKRLFQLGMIKSKTDNPEFDSTFFNLANERTQSYIGTNTASDFYTFLNNLEEFTEDTVVNTDYDYLLTDNFSQGSNLLSRKFNEKGKIISSGIELFSVGYVGGTVNQQKGKSKASSKLTYKERITQELNLNNEGWYMNLIPGDASLEWMIYMGNPISDQSLNRGMDDVNEIFKEYFISEFNVSREGRTIANVKGRKNTDLRFFKPILGEELHNKIVASNETAEDTYDKFSKSINSALNKYVEERSVAYENLLKSYSIYKITEDGKVALENVNIPNLSVEEMNIKLKASAINYMIANIEMHKLLYSDPYFYKDELKRIKSFNSPRQSIMNSSDNMNYIYDQVWNKEYQEDDLGYNNFNRHSFKSVAYNDIDGVIDLPGYGVHTETDGAGIISQKAYRELRIRAAEWNDNEEYQYRYDVAFEKRDKGLPLSEMEETILSQPNPAVKSTYTPSKPIVSGNKNSGKDYNDIILDKFALYPLSYRILKELNPDSNAIKLYNKMQKESIDYIVFDSSRKVSNTPTIDLYNEKGEFNNVPYTQNEIVNVPFKILGIQSEVPSKDSPKVTRGSQITKLATLDMMEAGVPIDYETGVTFNDKFVKWNSLSEEDKNNSSELYKEIKNNQSLLEELTNVGLTKLISSLGIKEKIVDGQNTYYIDDFSEAGNTLRNEIFKREVNDNISDSLKDFIDGKAVLEATPAYQQIRNILYSIADREVISPKISGGMKVQIPSTLLESVRAQKTTINGKEGYTSDVLKFYENKDGERVCEIMIGRWFNSKLSDTELLNYLNNTPEGQSILKGIGFRIPTQKQNSIDAFRIKQFLPKEFGDSVVIPSALVQKVGSDFDIDKLSVYLKNVFVDNNGNLKIIPYFGIGQQAIDQFKEFITSPIYNEKRKELKKLAGNNNLLDTLRNIVNGTAEEGVAQKWVPILAEFFPEQIDEDNQLDVHEVELILLKRIQRLNKRIEKITLEELEDIIVDERSVSMYKQSLENQYITSLENLVSSPFNFDRLIQPNSASYMKNIATKVAKAVYGEQFDYTDIGNMLSRSFMSRLRHSFVSGKYAIGIAAVSQTNHSLNQRQPIYIESEKIKNLSSQDQFWLGDGRIKFKDYNTIRLGNKLFPTLSMIKAKNEMDISDINGQFIDGYVDISKGPWIMELGATPNVASTWLFLVKLGVPFESISYFMNQPLIREYLKMIENAGYVYLFIDDYYNILRDEILEDTKTTQDNFDNLHSSFTIPSSNVLESNLGKEINKMNNQQKLSQLHMLKEFLKYAKMAEQLFNVTQGSNFDTANFNDPYLVFKKFKQLEKARNTIISSVDNLLANSFIGNLTNRIEDMRNSLATILLSDQDRVREVVQKVLDPYTEVPDRQFVKLAQKVVNDLFDWTVQTSSKDKLNAYMNSILGKDGVAKELDTFVKSIKNNPSHPLYNNLVINLVEYLPPSNLVGNRPFNIKIKNKENKAYDQNNMIYAFREIRNYLNSNNNPGLYNNLVTLSLLQSGLANSPISFTSLLPQEDVQAIYNDVIGGLNGLDRIDEFYSLDVLQRNNWNDSDIVPYVKASFIFINDYNSMSGKARVYNPSMKYLPENVKLAVEDAVIPPVVTQSTLSNAGKSEIIVFSWELQEDVLTPEEILVAKNSTGLTKAISEKKKAMRQAGDYSYIKKGLFKKVRDNVGNALIHSDKKKTKSYFVYKAMNAWGDSFRAQEFYETDRPSVFENGFVKVNSVSDSTIIDYFLNPKRNEKSEVKVVAPKNSVSLQSIQLRDGKSYNVSDINSKMLEAMGYSPLEIGQILKSIC